MKIKEKVDAYDKLLPYLKRLKEAHDREIYAAFDRECGVTPAKGESTEHVIFTMKWDKII